MSNAELLEGLPMADRIREGMADVAACLVSISSPRLRRVGLIDLASSRLQADPEFRLYDLLGETGGDTYSKYNALLRELASFENALGRRIHKNG